MNRVKSQAGNHHRRRFNRDIETFGNSSVHRQRNEEVARSACNSPRIIAGYYKIVNYILETRLPSGGVTTRDNRARRLTGTRCRLTVDAPRVRRGYSLRSRCCTEKQASEAFSRLAGPIAHPFTHKIANYIPKSEIRSSAITYRTIVGRSNISIRVRDRAA